MRPVLVGGAIGVLVTLLAANALRAALFGISPFDPTSFTVVAIILLVTGAAASYVPARHAAAVDPSVALRCD
jgi:ABC-type antimicrobial peptide transport system permease subunit